MKLWFLILSAALVAAPGAKTFASAAPRVSFIRADKPDAGDDRTAPRAAASDHEDDQVDEGNVTVGAGETTANDIVRLGGDVKVDGEAGHDVVVINGDCTINGSVRHDNVVVLGSNVINGHVDHDAVVVMGDLTLGPKAWIGHDVVCVAGALHRDPRAHVGGQVVNVGIFPHPGLGFRSWWQHGLSRFRIMGFGPNLGWLWGLSFGMLLFYMLCGAAMPAASQRCGALFLERPLAVIIAALLTLVALPFVFLLLCITLVGLPVALIGLPLALILFTAFGRAALYGLLGRSILGERTHPAMAILLGAVIALLVWMVPVIGLPLYLVVSFLGLGCSVAAVVLGRRPPTTPPSAVPAPARMTSHPAPLGPASDSVPLAAPGAATTTGPAEPPPLFTPVDTTVPPPPMTPPPTPAATPSLPRVAAPLITADLPRAGFWIRLVAMAIDVILVAFVSHLLAHAWGWYGFDHGPQPILILLAIYAAALWQYRGTTVGGIVCSLHVVRLDGRPVDWPTAIVRALGCFLSLVVFGLGFIWVAFDPEKQSWHDKIAGTTVVQSPHRRSLV